MNRAVPFALIPLLVFAVAFGIEEAIIVVYLRHLPDAYSAQAFTLEKLRELSTLFIIGAVAALVATSWTFRARAFCFAFGAWDIVYYIALWKLSGFPTLMDDDVLFLIPLPWVAPVWAPVAFALVLMLIGMFGVVRRRAPLLALSFVLALLSFVYRSAFGIEAYPLWLFVVALLLALAALPIVSVPERLRQVQ
jgi:hypothetical protein